MPYKNKEKAREKGMEYYQNNKDKIIKQRKKYYLNNKDKVKKINKEWKLNNKDKVKEYKKRYRLKNIDKLRKYYKEYQKEYFNKRYLNDKNFAIKQRLRRSLIRALRLYTTTGKIMASKRYCIDYNEIIKHLKPFPKDLSKYHVDHIRPLCSFDLTNPEEIKKAFTPNNHQWLLAEENLSKGGRS